MYETNYGVMIMFKNTDGMIPLKGGSGKGNLEFAISLARGHSNLPEDDKVGVDRYYIVEVDTMGRMITGKPPVRAYDGNFNRIGE